MGRERGAWFKFSAATVSIDPNEKGLESDGYTARDEMFSERKNRTDGCCILKTFLFPLKNAAEAKEKLENKSFE